jgi:hypothetical protein
LARYAARVARLRSTMRWVTSARTGCRVMACVLGL